ncbi:MAG: peptidoglycan DD-metalloendopeptidase family protein [Actinobacteria bacterium]|uniref:Unannotated protein n=1 Tax=freshwater metagenome TaxID=449393 RepID=A0A6J5YXH6_9ZZZZ|nr:peptidoglycan DD-metalloendopeptidase family protein [Actinomycetota bacterium]
MRALPQRFLRTAMAIPLVLGAMAGPVWADTLDDKVASIGEALTKATKEVLAAQKSLADAQKRLPAARQALATANVAKQQAADVYNEADAKLQVARKNFTDANSKLTSKQAEISKLQVKVNQFARAVYQQGQASQWEIVLEAQSPSDLTSRLQTIKSVAQASSSSLDDLAVAKSELKVEADKAEVIRLEMQGLADLAKEALDIAEAAAKSAIEASKKVKALIAQEASALDVAKKDRNKVKKQYDNLRAEQIRLAQQSGNASHGSGDPQATGPLSWPMPGRAAGGGVGWRVHPVYGYRSCHTGVDIGAKEGEAIHAADGGIVLSTSVSKAYGKVTMIDHGDGLVTMYAHQSKFGVKPGQVVGSGDVIGYIGSTGYSTGPHLHFEVHINGVPYDPMGWFGKAKVVVPCWG